MKGRVIAEGGSDPFLTFGPPPQGRNPGEGVSPKAKRIRGVWRNFFPGPIFLTLVRGPIYPCSGFQGGAFRLEFPTGSFQFNPKENAGSFMTENNPSIDSATTNTGERPFSPTYFAARDKFRKSCEWVGATLHTLPLTARGSGGEPLFTDIAWLGSGEPDRVLLVSSGLHGVEGFAGSAVQTALLDRLPSFPKDGAILLVHCLNPFGMAWLRRWNESNVDLNRNFFDPAVAQPPTPPIYRRANLFLNPPRPPSRDFFLIKALWQIARFGFANLKQAVASGQGEFPRGLFFRGRGPEESVRLYRSWLQQHLQKPGHLFVIDLHTGLGPFGHGSVYQKLTGRESGDLSEHLHRAIEWETPGSKGVGYHFPGGHDQLFLDLYSRSRIDYLTLEFGTYGNLKVLQALRAENQHHHFGTGKVEHWTKTDLKNAFCPPSGKWRQMVVEQGTGLVRSAAKFLWG